MKTAVSTSTMGDPEQRAVSAFERYSSVLTTLLMRCVPLQVSAALSLPLTATRVLHGQSEMCCADRAFFHFNPEMNVLHDAFS
ncbi:hypothetical protein E7T06_12585 [Deinococcus sp. Arct2-2]|uniref:hypothetical protein n=1 Tax=Deinococcus sp. Arct2-2 TaxID=2568653 RepID=UPI0010A4CA5F|nr:hypothetical protein [Deinococcus sp. Arct2-2]THF69319.1 hypothetical protein E7T06_12585 [Deinococcus sp. Arct2-2]